MTTDGKAATAAASPEPPAAAGPIIKSAGRLDAIAPATLAPPERSLFQIARTLANGQFAAVPRQLAEHVARFGEAHGEHIITAAFICKRYGQDESAALIFDDVIRANPGEPWAALMLATVAAQGGHWAEANARLAELRSNPRHVAPLFDLGDAGGDFYLDPAKRDAFLAGYFLSYRDQRPFADDIALSGAYFRSRIAALIRRHGFRRVVNVGCFVPAVDHSLAVEFPNVAFVGIDRDPAIIEPARAHFSASNLRLEAGEARHLLSALCRPGPALLCHMKTATYMSADNVRRLYDSARAAGISAVLSVEPYGFSRASGQFTELRGRPFGAVPLRGGMMIHDYAAYLRDAGYTTKSEPPYPMAWLSMGCHQYDLHLTTDLGLDL